MLGADGNGRRPGRRDGFGGGQHDDVSAAAADRARRSARGRLVQHHCRGGRPRFPADRTAAGVDDSHTDGRGRDAVQLVAQVRVGQHRQNAPRNCRAGAGGDRSPDHRAGSVRTGHQCPKAELWRETRVCTKTRVRLACLMNNTMPATRRDRARRWDCRENYPRKGTTPARGEEAEVVVYQPRGVGLIHTRHRPSDAHYTHDSGRLAQVARTLQKTLEPRNHRWPRRYTAMLELPFCRNRAARGPTALCWIGDRLRPAAASANARRRQPQPALRSADRGLLRPGQDGHRQVQHPGVQQTFLRSGPAQPAGRAQVQLRAIHLPDVGCRSRPDGPNALLPDQHVHRLGRRAGQVDRQRDAARHRRLRWCSPRPPT